MKPLVLFHISDLHFGREDAEALEWVREAIAAERPDAVLITGDLTMRGVTRRITLPVTYLGKAKDPWGNEYLDLRPAVLLVPVGLGGQARVINQSQYDPDTVANKAQMKPNVVAGLFRDIVDTPRLSGTRRYLFADPALAPVIEVAFLEGQESPVLESQDGWRVDGTEMKVRLDFGVAAVDYRGAVTNAGA